VPSSIPETGRMSNRACPVVLNSLSSARSRLTAARGLRRLVGSVPAPSPRMISERMDCGTALRARVSTAAAPPASSARGLKMLLE